MTTQYDAIGGKYERVKTEMLLARFPERATFEALTTDCAGKDVLDLACGTGWYSRILKQAGAKSVVGVDISAEMVAVAAQLEPANRYVTADARELGAVGEFDLVTAVWLLCYARNTDDLTAMARTAYENLKPGGEYVGIEMNPWFDWDGPPATKYGLTHEPDLPGGEDLTVTIHLDPPITFRACHWRAEPITNAFRAAGFAKVGFVPATEPAEPFWDEFRANPTFSGIRAVKGP